MSTLLSREVTQTTIQTNKVSRNYFSQMEGAAGQKSTSLCSLSMLPAASETYPDDFHIYLYIYLFIFFEENGVCIVVMIKMTQLRMHK